MATSLCQFVTPSHTRSRWDAFSPVTWLQTGSDVKISRVEITSFCKEQELLFTSLNTALPVLEASKE